MPTKPSTSFTFATDANFSSGPAVGNPVKVTPTGAAQGYVPGDGIESETVNYLMNICGAWITDWLIQGSSADDEDAHIVETDSDGRISCALFTCGGHSTNAITATFNPPTSGGTTIFATGDGGSGNAILASQASGSGAAARFTHAGTGHPVDAVTTGTNSAAAVRGSGSDTLNSIGVQGIAGDAATYGVYGQGGDSASSIGVYGISTHNDGVAIRGALPATATSSAYAVQGTGNGAGNGVLASVVGGGTGYPLYVFGDSTSPTKAGMLLSPQDTDPSSPDAGALMVHSGESNQLKLYRAQWEGVFSTRDGYVADIESGTDGSSASSSLTSKAAVQFTPRGALGAGAKVRIFASVQVGGSATLTGVDWEVYDLTATATVEAGSVTITEGTDAADEKCISLMLEYDLPSNATRTLQIRLARRTSAGIFYWANPTISVDGIYQP